jgi:hypothetical protein
VRVPTPGGIGSVDHVDPPSVVLISSGLPKMPNPTAVQSEVVAQDMPVSPLTWDGVFCVLHENPALAENNTVLTPAAKQTAVVGQEAERRRLVPAGDASFVQETPPEIVVIMAEPEPVLPLFPAATQSLTLEHEMPVMFTASLGADPDIQVLPLSDVRITYGVESEFVPPATQKSIG